MALNATSAPARLTIPPFQLSAQGDPPGGDVRQIPAIVADVEEMLHEREIDICHKSVRYSWNGFGQRTTGRSPS